MAAILATWKRRRSAIWTKDTGHTRLGTDRYHQGGECGQGWRASKLVVD
jgi:hypothetical protein